MPSRGSGALSLPPLAVEGQGLAIMSDDSLAVIILFHWECHWPDVTWNIIGPSSGFDYYFFLSVQHYVLTWTDLICQDRNIVQSNLYLEMTCQGVIGSFTIFMIYNIF